MFVDDLKTSVPDRFVSIASRMGVGLMAIGWLVAALAGIGRAQEPAQEFLEALRDNGYHDVALEYLDSIQNSDLISEDFKQVLPFERAETLIASVAGLRDLTLVDTRLDEAQQLLDQYAKANQSIADTARTLRFSGRLLSQRADIYLGQAASDRLTSGERDQFFAKARTMLENSLDNFRQAKTQLERLLDPNSPDAVRIDPEDPGSVKERQRLQSAYTQVTVQLPKVIEQLSDTYPAGDATRNQYLAEAVQAYVLVWDTYKRYPAGVQACVYAARCHQKLGNHQQSLDLLNEVFAMANSSVLRRFKQEAYVLAAKSWREIDPYPYQEVLAVLEPVVRTLKVNELREPDWLQVQYELARAKYASAEAIKAAGGPTANSDSKTMVRAAAKIMRNVARAASPDRESARTLLSEWNVPLSELAETAEAPTSFADALQLGRDAVAELESIGIEVTMLRRKIDAGPDSDPALQAELADVEQQLVGQSNIALEMLDLALRFSDSETSRGDINTVRYLQCFCYFASQRYIESALIGEFLVDRYPTEDGSRPASSLLIQSYSKLLDQAQPDDRGFERDRLQEACTEVLDRWPGSNEAGLAATTMTRLAMIESDYNRASEYIGKIPASSPTRGPLANRLGQRLWSDYRKQIDAGVPAATLSDQLEMACDLMKQGVSLTQPDQVDYDAALGALMLVDADLARGKVDEAVKQLETANVAPLDLVKQKHPSVTDGPNSTLFVRETYKIAIKTYLAAMRQDTDRQKWVDKASGIVAAMRQTMEASNDPNDRLRVTAIYRLIAIELKAGFDGIADPSEKQEFAEMLFRFLGSIEKESQDARTVLWAGATMLEVAGELSDSGLKDAAQPMFQQAVSALSRAETIGFADEPNADALKTELKRQRALAQRGGGNFKQAVDQLIEILTAEPSRLDIQIDAATTLQQWGKSTGLSRPLAEATNGSGEMTDPRTNRKTRPIWGWKKILMATRSNERYLDTYYLALFNIVEGRFEYGKIENSSKAIASALTEIERERERSPDFGGLEKWQTRFTELEKQIKAKM